MQELEDFLNSNGYRDETVRRYRYHLEALSGWLNAQGLTFEKMEPCHFWQYKTARGWTINHAAIAAFALRAFVKWRYGDTHPLLGLRIRREETPEGRTLNESEVDRLLASFDDTKVGIRNKALTSLLLDTGLRASAVCRLRLADVDLEKRQLGCREKGGKWRRARFSEFTADQLRRWLPTRAEFIKPKVDTLFCSVGGNTPGRPLTRYGLTWIWRDAARRAGLKALSTHDFRRSACCLFIKRGGSPRLAMLAFDWSTMQMVEIYSRALRIDDACRFLPLGDRRGET